MSGDARYVRTAQQIRRMSATASRDGHDVSRPIESANTTLHDPARWPDGRDQGELRLYCTASPYTHGEANARWTLLLCAPVRTKRGKSGKRFAIGSVSMAREDLLWLRDQINVALRRKT